MDTYEKKYKEALELARVAAFNGHQSLMEGIFPELAESEDERIRKEIIEAFKTLGDGKIPVVINYADIFTWLEKQGKIDEDLIVKKFLINKGYPIDANGTFPTYEELYNIIREGLENQCEQKHAEWSDEDEYMLNETIQHLKELIEIDKAHHLGCDVQFYQRDIDWLEFIKNRVQTKQEWSEMDENIISEVIQNYESGFLPSVIERDRIVKALKSLKQKIGWKPSDEQMSALENFIGTIPPYEPMFKVLKSLYNELKKL